MVVAGPIAELHVAGEFSDVIDDVLGERNGVALVMEPFLSSPSYLGAVVARSKLLLCSIFGEVAKWDGLVEGGLLPLGVMF